MVAWAGSRDEGVTASRHRGSFRVGRNVLNGDCMVVLTLHIYLKFLICTLKPWGIFMV